MQGRSDSLAGRLVRAYHGRVSTKIRTLSAVCALSIVPLLSTPALRAEAISSLSQIHFFSIHVEDGLSNESVYCELQDKRGFVWIGTFGGLNRYDGRDVVAYKPGGREGYSLSASVVFALAEGSDGTVWVGTDGGGLNRLDPESGKVDIYRGSAGGTEGLGSDLVYALASEPDGDLWVGTGGEGLVRRSDADGRFRHFTVGTDDIPSDVVRALLLDTSGRLWVGTAKGGLVLAADIDKDSPLFEPVPLAGASRFPTVRALHEDDRGRVWIGTEGDGLFVVERTAKVPVRIRTPVGVGGEEAIIRAINSDAEGRIWVGTDGLGVAVLSSEGEPTAEFHGGLKYGAGTSGNQVRAIMRDRSGLMWIGFKDRGISIGNPASVVFGLRAADEKHGLPQGTVRDFSEDSSGRLWVASDGGGLVAYDDSTGSFRVYGNAEGIPSSRLCSVLVSRTGAIFAGTDGAGLFVLKSGAERFRPVPLKLGVGTDVAREGDAVVWALYEDSHGNLWIGMEGAGLIEIRPDGSQTRWQYGAGSRLSLAGRSVRCLLEDRGSMLVGTWDAGLHRILPDGTVTRYGIDAGSDSATNDVSIYAVFRDSKDRLWIGTGSGLDRVEGESGTERVVHVPLGSSPKHPGIFGIIEDAGFLWLSTEDGLLRFDPASSAVLSWTYGDGLQDDHFAPGSCLKLADGRIALGGIEGFNLFDPASIVGTQTAPQVRIMSFVALDDTGPVEKSSAVPADGAVFRVPYATPGFSLTIAVLDYTDTDKNQHGVRIEGRRSQRFNLGPSNTAIVPRLEPGRYRFIAEGAGNRGVWNESGSSVVVEVVPPFWMEPFFLVSLCLVLALGVFGGVRLRLSQLEKRTRELRALSAHIHEAREEERTEMAREVHDELGQTLTALKMGLYWARENTRIASAAMGAKLGELLVYIDTALDSVKAISTRLRPKALDTLPLADALEWLVRDFQRWSGVSCSVALDPTPLDLDQRVKTAVFRVLQENLTNIARHSGASSADIAFALDGGWLELRVADNGHGIAEGNQDAERSFGIAGMRERCEYLGGSFSIVSSPGGGTSVVARLPRILQKGGRDA